MLASLRNAASRLVSRCQECKRKHTSHDQHCDCYKRDTSERDGEYDELLRSMARNSSTFDKDLTTGAHASEPCHIIRPCGMIHPSLTSKQLYSK